MAKRVKHDPHSVLKSIEMTIKSVSRDIRKNHGGADRINRLGTLVNSYSRLALILLGEEEEKSYNHYDSMNNEALAMIEAKRQKRLKAEAAQV